MPRTAGRPIGQQRNFSDPDSRLQKTREGFIQGYNAQIAVDGANQIILAHRVQTNAADYDGLAPLPGRGCAADAAATRGEVSGDAGFCNESNLAHLAERDIRAYLAPGRAAHRDAHAAGQRRAAKGSRVAAMATTLKRAGRRSRYRLRKQIVEPVFGQIKAARGFRQFGLRGLGQGKGRMGAHLHRPQSPQARQRNRLIP